MDLRIERLQRRTAGDPHVISFAGGLPADAQFPRRALSAAFLRVVARPETLQYGWPEGHEPLRRWVAERLRARGAAVEADEVIITSGAQQAIAIAAQLACRRGERVSVGAESYPAALDLFRTRGAAPTPDEDGAAIYAMPALANPRGRSLSAEARAALLSRGRPILEDDAYAELRFDGPAPRPLLAEARARVWHIGTVSKTLAPGLRVGWLIAPPRQHRRALRLKRDRDLQASSLAQAVVAEYLACERFDARLARLRRFYGRRAERLAEALSRWLPRWRFVPPEGGFSIWVEPDGGGDDAALLRVAVKHGVAFDPGRSFRAGDGPMGLRLCYSAVDERAIDEGVRRLARAWDAYRLTGHDSRRARVGRRRAAPRVRPLHPRSRRGAAAVDPLVAKVGRRAARR